MVRVVRRRILGLLVADSVEKVENVASAKFAQSELIADLGWLCPWSVRNSAWSELAVLVLQPPAQRPARTFIIDVYSGGSLKSAAVVIANRGKSGASVAKFRAN